jgi:glycosyltransferase involved in cell wall biosynthesis
MIENHILPFSVIIPTYNYAHYLEACITSIIVQAYSVQEIIIVDDGSMDDTKELVQSLNKKYEKYNIQYFYQENKGVSAARNYGYTIAKGEYLLFLDADDKLLPNAFEIFYSVLNKHRDSDMFFGGYIAYNHKGKKKNRIPEPLSSDKLSNVTKILNGEMVGLRPSSTLIKRTVMDKVLFRDDVHIGEDTLFFTQVLFSKKCASTQEPVVEMRRHNDSLRENYQRMIETGTNGIKQVFSLLPKTNQMENLYLKQILNCYLKIGRMAYLEADYKVASQYYSKAYKLNPNIVLRWKHLPKAVISIIKYKSFKRTVVDI